MTLLLNWRVWVAIGMALAISLAGWKGYGLGKESVQGEFDKYKAEQVAQALKVDSENRAKEQGMQLSLENLTNAYIKNQKANSANAIAANNSLRELQTTIDSPTGTDSPASRSTDGRAGLEQELLGNCAATLVRLAQEADGLEARLVGLQTYIKGVVQK